MTRIAIVLLACLLLLPSVAAGPGTTTVVITPWYAAGWMREDCPPAPAVSHCEARADPLTGRIELTAFAGAGADQALAGGTVDVLHDIDHRTRQVSATIRLAISSTQGAGVVPSAMLWHTSCPACTIEWAGTLVPVGGEWEVVMVLTDPAGRWIPAGTVGAAMGFDATARCDPALPCGTTQTALTTLDATVTSFTIRY